jgi:uncharacterized coiled-coil protein SlyX
MAMQSARTPARSGNVTKAFESVQPEALTETPALNVRMAHLESQMKRASDFIEVLAERLGDLESQNAELKDEIMILRASRVRSPSSPYNTVTPPDETVRPGIPSLRHR